jgi:predicted CoA-binding protein
MNDTDMTGLLQQARTIAVVGLSPDPYRASYQVAKYLERNGYALTGVNPTVEGDVDGIPVVANLADLAEPPDIVDVFRRPEYTADVARQAVECGAKAIWLQLGIRNPEAGSIASGAGLAYVEDRCIKIDHARLLGGH